MLKNNTVLKILSVLIAVCLWMYVMGSVNPMTTQTIENIPVELLNQDTLQERGLAVRSGMGFSVDVIVEGNRSILHELDKDKVKATVDVFGYEEGQNSVPVQVEVPDNVRLKEVKTPRIDITVDELISAYKKVDVKFVGRSSFGTEPGVVATSPAEIEVKGAKTLVNSVKTVQARLNAAEISDDPKSFRAKLQALNQNGEQIYDVTLSAETVGVEAALYYTKTVTLEVKTAGDLPKGYELEEISAPKEIKISGMKDDLDSVEKIETEPVDMRQIKSDTAIELKPILPSGIQVSQGSKKAVAEIKIKRLTE
ncbi:MAG: hypothetical protein HFE75_08940 [Firmicutes bacterium]|jgi:YbbR domain-containing protein|nr:hypothetical protein [Bacillota bacterium]NBI64830.1 hypothetical protein [Clostridiales bacterium]